MKYFFSALFFLLFHLLASAQENKSPTSFEADYFYGSIIEHNPDISHLITKHPKGLILSYNRKTFGFKEVQRRYNYPDWGFTFAYQNFDNPILGENYGLYGHFNFYFLNRNAVVRIGQGIAYNTNPYDRQTNPKNNAFGSSLLSSTLLKLNYVKENIYKGLGFHAGVSLIHYSNANYKAPNNSTNTFAFNAGLSYLLDYENTPEFITEEDPPSRTYAERLKYNFAFRFGANESDVIGQGQYMFYVASAFVDKRINYKSTFQAGVDVFFAEFLKEFIYYKSVAFPEENVSGDEDYRRVGIFIGHELRFHKTAFVSQLGYYVYWPYEFENRIYNRLGIKRYFYNDKIFGSITVKAHWAKAEGVEFGIGVRL